MDQQISKKRIAKKRIFLIDKQDTILSNCFSLCTQKIKPGTSLVIGGVILENCNIKLVNAYSFMFDILADGGISRTPNNCLKPLVI